MRTSSSRALFGCAAITILAGCSGASRIVPTQTSTLAQNANVDRSVDLGLVPGRSRRETIDGTGTRGQYPCSPTGRGGGTVSVSPSGTATGRYGGTFTASAAFHVVCPKGKTSAMGTFTIISGVNTIAGTFSGPGKYACARATCWFNSKDLTYAATLVRGGMVLKNFSGRATGTVDSAGLHVTLDAM